MKTFQGFKNFLMQGNVIVAAIGLSIALAFSTLVKAFTDNIITPLVNAAGSPGVTGLGVHVHGQLIDFGAAVSAIIYFVIFMTVIYFLIVVPFRLYEARLGNTVFGPAAPTQTCPECQSDDLPVKAIRCKYCASDLRAASEGPVAA
jgi:large conductance mechanosensitive channel